MAALFRPGDLEVKGFSDGMLKTSIDIIIGMERAEAQRIVGASDDGSVFIPVNNFLFQRGAATVLIDAGAGDTMQPSLGKLAANLQAENLRCADVTQVVLTHLHPDHANGLVDDAGEALYPEAEILVHAQELDFWMGEGSGTEAQAAKRVRARTKINLKPYRDRIRPMQDGEEVAGCTPLLAPGHSPGHTCWRIGIGTDALLAWGDLVHFSALQIAHPEVAVKYDLDPELARRSRLRMLDMIATERLAIAGAHVAAPGFGFVQRRGSSYLFQPA